MANVPNVLPFTTDVTFYFYAPSTLAEIVVYYDNGTSGQDAFLYCPDGSSYNLGHTTQSQPLYTVGGISGTYYFLVRYSGNALLISYSTSFDLQQVETTALTDGQGFGLLYSTSSSSGVTVNSGGTTVIPANGGGNWKLRS